MVRSVSLLMVYKNLDVKLIKTHIKPNHAIHFGKKITVHMVSDVISHIVFLYLKNKCNRRTIKLTDTDK